MKVMDDGTVKLRDGAMAWHGIDGEGVVLDIKRSAYLGLNGSAALLWSMLAEGTERSALISRLVGHFDIHEARASRDVDAFLDEVR